jgi:hypothetical protein
MISLLLTFFLSETVQARVFDFNQTKVATYFKGNAGFSYAQQDAYKLSSGANTIFSDQPPYNWGGEFGLLFAANKIGLRLGYELVNPFKQSGIEGVNSSGTQLLTLDSQIIGKFPVAHVELYAAGNRKTNRMTVSGGYGYGTVDLNNTYSNITGYAISNYTEKGTAAASLLEFAVGFEYLFVDNVTMILDAGYRDVTTGKFKAQNSFTNMSGQSIIKGDVLKNSDSSNRSLNLDGYWVGIGFRFYITL